MKKFLKENIITRTICWFFVHSYLFIKSSDQPVKEKIINRILYFSTFIFFIIFMIVEFLRKVESPSYEIMVFAEVLFLVSATAFLSMIISGCYKLLQKYKSKVEHEK